MQTDLITKVYFNEHLTHSCVGMPQGLQALSSSYYYVKGQWEDSFGYTGPPKSITSHYHCHNFT